MKSLSCSIIVVLAAVCHGLQLSLDTVESSLGAPPSACATLTCTEEVWPSTLATNLTDGNETDPATSYNEFIITRLRVYRKVESSTKHDNSNDGSLLVTLTDSLITVMDSALDIVYGGHMTASHASIRLGLMTLETCKNEYTCEVLLTDQFGGQHISKLNVHADHQRRPDQCPANPDIEWTTSYFTDPEHCEIGVVPIAFQHIFPYVVIEPNEDSVAQVPIVCETHTLGGGWIVFQRRSTGNVNFYRGWEEYKNGFGSLADDFWLGLQTIHDITASGTYELMVLLEYEGVPYSAHYDAFSVADEDDNFRLMLGEYDGTAGDSLSGHDGMAFSTYDNDNDVSSLNHAESYDNAWWFNFIDFSSLNGVWQDDSLYGGLYWNALSGSYYSLSFSQMMMRKID